jgi:rhodanese-related sulfurtransferase
MRAALAIGILAIALVPATVHSETKPANDARRTVTVGELSALRTAGKAVIVDANSAETRQKYGVIPGAVLLTHYADYDATRELPSDRSAKLVFYCANEKCMASHKAADRAVDAGYTDVSVLQAGIMGWKNAGQPIAPSGT